MQSVKEAASAFLDHRRIAVTGVSRSRTGTEATWSTLGAPIWIASRPRTSRSESWGLWRHYD